MGSFPYSLLLQAPTSTNTSVLADEMEWLSVENTEGLIKPAGGAWLSCQLDLWP